MDTQCLHICSYMYHMAQNFGTSDVRVDYIMSLPKRFVDLVKTMHIMHLENLVCLYVGRNYWNLEVVLFLGIVDTTRKNSKILWKTKLFLSYSP